MIWAIGSSWTNFLGDGYPLIRAIRQRFPDAPEIIYRKHAGSGTPWEYVRGWVQQFVAADSPDLILTYTNGSPEGPRCAPHDDPPIDHGRRDRAQPAFLREQLGQRRRHRARGRRLGSGPRNLSPGTMRSSSRIAASWPVTCSGSTSGPLLFWSTPSIRTGMASSGSGTTSSATSPGPWTS